MPRKAVELPVAQIEELARIGCTMAEVGNIYGLTRSAISRRLSAGPLRDAWERGQANGCESLRRAQMKAALNGSVVMQKWLGVQRLGQSDKTVSEQHIDQEITNKVVTSYEAVWGGSFDDD